MQPRAALAETQGLVPAALHLTHHEDPERQNDDKWRCVEQDRDPASRPRVLDRDVDLLLVEQLEYVRIVGGNVGMEALVRILEDAVYLTAGDAAGDLDLRDLAAIHLVHELGESERPFPRGLTGA